MEQPTPTVAPPTSPPQATAKPRKSRRAWYVVGFLLLLVMVPVAWYFISGWLGDRDMEALYAELDAEDPDWRWPDLVGKLQPVPGEENSVEQILKVSTLATKGTAFNAGPKWDQLHLVVNARLAHETAEAGRSAFGRSAPNLRDEARKLKDMPSGRFAIPIEGNIFTMDLNDIQRSRETCRVLYVDALVRAHDGDMDGAAESCQAIVNTAGAFRQHPILVGYLVRCAEQAIAIDAIQRTLGQGSVTEPQLKKLQDLLQREVDNDGLLDAMRGERAGTHQLFASLRDGRMTLSQLTLTGAPPGSAQGVADRLLDAFPGTVLRQYPAYLRYMTEYVRACKRDMPEREEKLLELDKQTRTKSNMLMRLMMPAVAKVAQASTRSQAALRCATVAVAAERYRIKHGAWPAAPNDLVQDGLLAKLPNDPYDGKSLRWKRTQTGFVIYSVSLDKTDNGGNLNRGNPYAVGADLGFELFDPAWRGVPAPVADGS
jgi:hypothetical protein